MVVEKRKKSENKPLVSLIGVTNVGCVNQTKRKRRKIKIVEKQTIYESVAIQTYLEKMSIEDFVKVEIITF